MKLRYCNKGLGFPNQHLNQEAKHLPLSLNVLICKMRILTSQNCESGNYIYICVCVCICNNVNYIYDMLTKTLLGKYLEMLLTG